MSRGRPSLLGSSAEDRKRLLELVRPYRRRIATLSGVSFISGTIEALFLVLVTKTALSIADDADNVDLIAGVSVTLRVALAVSFALILVRLAVELTNTMISSRLREAVGADLRDDLVSSFLSSDWATQQNEPSGRLLQLGTSFVAQAVSNINSLTGMIATFLNLLAMLVTSLFVDPLASVVVILALVTLTSLLAPLRIRVKARARKNSEAQKAYANMVSEFGQMGLEMQVFGVVPTFTKEIRRRSARVAHTARRATQLQSLVPQFYTSLAFIAILIGLAIASSVGVSELSSVGAVMLVMLRSLNYGRSLQMSSSSLAGSMPFLQDLQNARDRYRANAATNGTVVVDDLRPIRVSNMSFSYNVDRPALSDVSFSIEPGEVIGIIGPSGSGKSTLVQLLLGLREPTSGSISIGETPLSDVDRSSWTRNVSFVPQDAHLYTGTVTENIRYFRDDITDEDIVEASRQAHVLDDVLALPEGFDTHIGQRGVQLSGGQRQRISIARALVGRPKLLLLDEPTSALDVHSEAMIRKTVSDLHGKVTVIVIAHRLSTLDMCDRLMVIENGRMVAFEAPEKLRQDSEFYRQALTLSGLS